MIPWVRHFTVIIIAIGFIHLSPEIRGQERIPKDNTFKLPPPQFDSNYSLEKALKNRRSKRSYSQNPITIHELSQLLWAAQGKTGSRGLRTSPSAGALYPLEIYVAIGDVDSISSGVYKYLSRSHKLKRIKTGDVRSDLYNSALDQLALKNAPISIIIAAVYQRTTQKYGSRGMRYVQIEVGHVSQNIYLQCTSMGIGTVSIGAFQDREIQEIAGLSKSEKPLIIMPVGRLD